MRIKYEEFNDEEYAFQQLKVLLEEQLGRDLTKIEARKIRWLSGWEHETVGVFFDLIHEIAGKKNEGGL
ncbi:hypothetical protein [Halobacillus karajensis]|uniref:Uncharacterized protein n=1 Tax=Halobacillus karajensis TaxID=195088 RepID=A0A059NW52_9BACI|nr:hypothetical protein [Halobacillus karajensis]CDQ20318.1 hypothetical protein BN982_02647 [Halobacillus karajensis]CDQ23614.1 hypothetical protein BN983_01860 [Halobacillus karajensis]CDQ27093.1 hypothetical protein BN981_01342 [Halobacillus karajensis]